MCPFSKTEWTNSPDETMPDVSKVGSRRYGAVLLNWKTGAWTATFHQCPKNKYPKEERQIEIVWEEAAAEESELP